jgi:hypothetical protein
MPWIMRIIFNAAKRMTSGADQGASADDGNGASLCENGLRFFVLSDSAPSEFALES